MSAVMVRALLAGQKTQTRRKYKPRAPEPYEVMSEREDGARWPYCEYPDTMSNYEPVPCPYGEIGDRLWVRETYYCDHCFAGDVETTRKTYVGRALTDEECIAEWRGLPIHGDLTPAGHMMYYRADGEAHEQFEQIEEPFRWRPGIHMWRWASRITLEITDVRIQRLQDISEEDAEAEGVSAHNGDGTLRMTARNEYQLLWEEINGKGSWERNDWVWALSFRVVQP